MRRALSEPRPRGATAAADTPSVLALTTDQLPEPAIVLDGDGTIREANAQVEACFGLAPEELVGSPLARIVARPEEITEAVRTAGAQGLWTAQIEGYRADGVPFPLEVSGRVVDRGARLRSLALMRDCNAPDRLNGLARHHFDAAFDASPIGMALYNTDGQFVRVNDAMCQLLGREASDLLGTRDQELTHPEDRETDLAAARRVLAGEIATFQTEKRFLRPGGEIVWAIANLTFLRDENGRPISWLGQFQDVTEHRRLAACDALTDLPNRRHLEHALAEHLRHGARYGPSGALALLDLDGFKDINDRFGHRAGDEVLVSLARTIRGRLRDTDLVARLGGDEFAVVLPHAEPDEAEHVGRTLVDLIAGLRFSFAPERAIVTASVGITPLAAHGTRVDLALAAADSALYHVKRAGGNRCALRLPRSD